MKRLAGETAIYGVSSIVGKFLNWMLVPMYTRVLATESDFGIVTNLYAWTALLMVILTYGMETGFFRFMNKKEIKLPMRVYATTLFSLAFTSVLFMVFVFSALTPVSNFLGYGAHPEYIGMMAGIVAVDAFCCIPFAFLRYQGKAVRFAAIKLLNIFLNIVLVIFFLIACPWLYECAPRLIGWFYVPGYQVEYIFVSNVVTSVVTFLLLVPDMIPGLREKASFVLLKQMLRYSFPILVLGIAGIFNQTADKILFPFLFEDKDYAATQLGIYGACFKVAVVMVMFIQAFRYAYEPFIFAKNKDDDNTKAYSEAMKYFIIFSLIIFLGVMYYLDILKYFVDAKYYPGLRVVPIVMLGELFFGIYFNLSFWYKLIDQTQWGSLLLDDRLCGDRVDDRVAGAGLRLYGVCLGFVCQQPVDDDSFLCDRAEEVPDSIRYKISRYLRHIGGFILCSWDVAPDRFGNPSLGLSHGSTPDFPGNHH